MQTIAQRSGVAPDSIPTAYAAEQKLTEAYRKGWSHGHGIACHNVPEIGKTYWLDGEGRLKCDAENIGLVHQALCFAAADNSRCYSPFEFTASAFNADEDADELWAAFEDGTADAIFADLAGYTYEAD